MKHGTENRYQAGCSCARCRKAHVAYNSPRDSARRAASAALRREYPDRFRELYETELLARGLAPREGIA